MTLSAQRTPPPVGDTGRAGRAAWHRRTGLLPLAYLSALVVVALIHPFLPSWRWLTIHLLLLGAVTNAIMVWSAHFAAAVLRSPAPVRRRGEVIRLAVLNLGIIGVINDGSIDHGVYFHAGALAPDEPMRPIDPGQRLTYRFTATKAGIWMYHCSTMPMLLHIGNGMYGAVVIDPPDLSTVDREYVLVQSELYLGPDGEPGDLAKMQAETPDAVVFNGYLAQYAHRPLSARPGQRVRIWVLNAGPNRTSAFHIVGAQFDTVYREGRRQLRPTDPGAAQVLDLTPAGGGFVETVLPAPGHYPFVSHVMVDADRGARGIIEVR